MDHGYCCGGLYYEMITRYIIGGYIHTWLSGGVISLRKRTESNWFFHNEICGESSSGYMLPVRDIRPTAGAGFLYPLCGAMRTMPGMPSHPASEYVDIDKNGKTRGLF